MKFKDSLIQNVINPQTKSKLTNAMGQVVRYNPGHNVADVSVVTSNSGAAQVLRDVPVQLTGNGFHSGDLKEGDTVYIQFNNGTIFQPKIIGKADEYYATNTREQEFHPRQGELCVSQEKLEGEVSPSSDTWLDTENSNFFKYSSYKDRSPVENISQKREVIGYFKNQEVGVYNPTSTGLLKIQDDGTINIFTDTNLGIRINTQNKTVEFFGDSTTKSDKWTVISNTVEIKANEKLSIITKELNISAETVIRNGESV